MIWLFQWIGRIKLINWDILRKVVLALPSMFFFALKFDFFTGKIDNLAQLCMETDNSIETRMKRGFQWCCLILQSHPFSLLIFDLKMCVRNFLTLKKLLQICRFVGTFFSRRITQPLTFSWSKISISQSSFRILDWLKNFEYRI